MKKKLRIYKKMRLNIDDEIQEIKVYYDDLDYVDGYASLCYMINDNEVMCTVLDKRMNPVIPCRISSINEMSVYTNVFENGMALYQEDNCIYTIDLKDVEFVGTKPKNYVNKMNAYLPVDTKRVIAVNQEFYLYDVANNKRLTEDFSYIELKKNKLIWYLVFGVLENEQRYLYASGYMNKNGKLNNEVLIDDVKAWYSDADLKDVEKIRTLSLDNYNKLKENESWKIIQ